MTSRAEAVERALNDLIEEKVDYMRLNNLGDPEAQHTIKNGRAALAALADPKPTGPVGELVKRLRVAPTIKLPYPTYTAEEAIALGRSVRQMMIERAEAANALERLTAQCDELSSAGAGIFEQGQTAIAREQERAETAEAGLSRLTAQQGEAVAWAVV